MARWFQHYRGAARFLPLFLFCASALYSQTPDPAGRFRLGQALEQAGEFDKAAAIYRELSAREPGNILYVDALQRALVQLKEYDEAAAIVTGRLAQQPGDIGLRTTLAGIYQRAGKEIEATAEWERVIASAPQNPNVYRIIASNLIEHRLLERAAAVYRRGRAACGDPLLFTLELSQLLGVMMEYEGATEELVAWLRKNPSQSGFVQGRLTLFSAKPDGRRAAIAVVERELRRQEEVRLVELLAWLQMEGKDYRRALELYRRIDTQTGAQGGALLEFANRAAGEGAFDVAVEGYAAAIAVPLPPAKLPSARYGEANALAELAASIDSARAPKGNPGWRPIIPPDRFTRALQAYRQITREFPRSEFAAKAFYRIGMIQMERLFDIDGALASFRQAGSEAGVIRTILHDVSLKEGMLLVMKGDTTGGGRKFAEVAAAVDATPDQGDEAKFRLAEIAFFGGRFDDATAILDSISLNLRADYANDALSLASFVQENAGSSPVALKMFGAAEFLARQRKNSEAIARFRQSVESAGLSPLGERGMMRIAALQEAMGEIGLAVATYEEILTRPGIGEGSSERVRLALAEAYDFGLGNRQRAIEEYGKLLADFPTSIHAESARKRIRLLRGDTP